MGAYITDGDVQATHPPEVYTRLFDTDGDGVVNSGDVETYIARVETNINAALKQSHDTPFTIAPDFIKQIALELLPWEVAKWWPANATGQSPYRLMFEDANKKLVALARDKETRLPTGPGEPTASLAEQDTQITANAPIFSSFERDGTPRFSGF